MYDSAGSNAHDALQRIAFLAMRARGLDPEFSAHALQEAEALDEGRLLAQRTHAQPARDLRHLLWCSIDNDDSRDLDQLSVAEEISPQKIKVFVAVADVAIAVKKGSALDQHARTNTTSVYTAARTFPMLPDRLSTDLTSLNPNEDRRAVVIEMVVPETGVVESGTVYEALVRNTAQLSYNRVAAWLEGGEPVPAAVAKVPGLELNLRLQLRAAAALNAHRHARGALAFETAQARPVFANGKLEALDADRKNSAKELIEDLMIAANGAVASFLGAHRSPSIRRVVRTPKQWERIVELAAERGAELPASPDVKALELFLESARRADPEKFPDLSLSIIKLLGAGEYVVNFPGQSAPGHFGLAVRNYSHSTAPNRRFPDLLTQRLLKAVLHGEAIPYAEDELKALAQRCTAQEDAAKKVERQVLKAAAAMLLEQRIGERFDAIVTGASAKGTWVRIQRPLVEGKLVKGFEGRRVGDRLSVQLVRTEIERGLIDFVAS
ncbi:MAG TPA: RNB domain-containing ribonuclease [Opitutaceae bacterium]|nr:RNB domain-containing ribonuclease [Opitutaceae bacterium]